MVDKAKDELISKVEALLKRKKLPSKAITDVLDLIRQHLVEDESKDRAALLTSPEQHWEDRFDKLWRAQQCLAETQLILLKSHSRLVDQLFSPKESRTIPLRKG